MTGCSTTRTHGPIRAFAGDQPDCYLRGTRIVTPTGAVCVEELGIGDSVVTRFSGIQPVKWIGRQSFDQRFVELGRAHIPVCIHAGALGQNMPARDLYVSPGHSMLVGHTLVLASSLVNGLTITQDEAPPVIDYFQIELAAHDCVVAEGAWSETYADGPCVRAQFHNAAEFYALYPDEPAPDSLNLCAPRPERGTELAAVLRPIVARAAAGLQPGHLHGHIDRVEGGLEIDGWAIDVSHPELPVLLEVLVEDRVIGTVLACDYRADLAAAGLGAGNCAFFFRSDIRLRPEALCGLQIRRASDGADLPIPAVMTSARLEAPPELDLALTLAA